jgi:hypothetical protein
MQFLDERVYSEVGFQMGTNGCNRSPKRGGTDVSINKTILKKKKKRRR